MIVEAHVTSQILKICFLFIPSCNFYLFVFVTLFLLLVERVFLSFHFIEFLVTRDLNHSQITFLTISKLGFLELKE